MFPALRPNGIARWLAVVLALLGCAALLGLSLALSEGRKRGPATATVSASAPMAPAAEAAPLEALEVAAEARREVATGLDLERGARVRGAAETLARALEAETFEEAAWRAAVASEASQLGAEALPALRALLADETRSPEEHVAASELVAALNP